MKPEIHEKIWKAQCWQELKKVGYPSLIYSEIFSQKDQETQSGLDTVRNPQNNQNHQTSGHNATDPTPRPQNTA